MKLPIWYNDEIVGYEDEKIVENDKIIKSTFYLFDTQHLSIIKNNIQNSLQATITKDLPDLNNIKNNNLYSIELNNKNLILTLIKNE